MLYNNVRPLKIIKSNYYHQDHCHKDWMDHYIVYVYMAIIRFNSATVKGFDGGAFSQGIILWTFFFIVGTENKLAHIAWDLRNYWWGVASILLDAISIILDIIVLTSISAKFGMWLCSHFWCTTALSLVYIHPH